MEEVVLDSAGSHSEVTAMELKDHRTGGEGVTEGDSNGTKGVTGSGQKRKQLRKSLRSVPFLLFDHPVTGLYKNYISDIGARDVADLVEVCPSLTYLKMGKNMITHEGGTYLAKAIQKSRTIEEAGFWGNQLGDKGAEAFAEALTNHHSLKTLSLAANGISKGSQHLAKALCNNNSLKIFWLTQNELDDEAAESFGEMLRVNISLEKLWLNENKITSKGAAHLLQSLKGNTTIDEICLKDNQILPDDVQHLTEEKRIVI